MARSVDSWPEHHLAKYPWDEWMAGGVWEIRRGEDFNCLVETMRAQLFVKAGERRLRVTTRVRGNSLTFEFQERKT